jgi:membrane protease YdiL (CAAX protease family)
VNAQTHEDDAPLTSLRRPSLRVIAFVVGYVAVVLCVDTLAALRVRVPIDWTFFVWRAGPWRSFDVFKFVFWFLIPSCIALRRIDWGAFGIARWKRWDYGLLAGMVLVGAASFIVIPLIPDLNQYYQSASGMDTGRRVQGIARYLIWTLSWLTGWEFMHRYWLPRYLVPKWPRFGWLLIPIFETIYHLQKPWSEAILVAVFSFVATPLAIHRKNVLLPFLAHFIIEFAVALYMAG